MSGGAKRTVQRKPHSDQVIRENSGEPSGRTETNHTVSKVLGLGARHGGIVKLSVVRCVTAFTCFTYLYLQTTHQFTR